MAERILLIDDDESLADMVREYLSQAGLVVEARHDLRRGLSLLEREHFDALILDVMLPDGDGFEACRQLRAVSDLPILMLTARGDETDRIVGLELGADDYLPKPFNPRELLARLRAILRRRGGARVGSRALLKFGSLEIDRDARQLRMDGEERDLTGHQFDLLCALAENAGRVMSREALVATLRGDTLGPFDRSIDVHISRVRAVIERDPKHPRRVITVRGAGYVFARESEETEP